MWPELLSPITRLYSCQPEPVSAPELEDLLSSHTITPISTGSGHRAATSRQGMA